MYYPKLKKLLLSIRMSMFPKFRKFAKIPRLEKECIITEKIDGTNAQIYITKSGKIYAGSRNRWLVPGKRTDNYGFAEWVKENEETLRYLGPGRHYGEWFGRGINRGYGLDVRYFALFNVDYWQKLNIASKAILGEKGVVCVPVVGIGNLGDKVVEKTMALLKHKGSILVPRYHCPEGIVIYHTASNKLFKKTFDL